jgi:hypothetical protein
MTANPICRRATVRSTQNTQTPALDPEFREQGERLLRDLAFVLHLTRKVKDQMRNSQPTEEPAGEPCLALVGACDECR